MFTEKVADCGARVGIRDGKGILPAAYVLSFFFNVFSHVPLLATCVLKELIILLP